MAIYIPIVYIYPTQIVNEFVNSQTETSLLQNFYIVFQIVTLFIEPSSVISGREGFDLWSPK
jgi:hypothetical protein